MITFTAHSNLRTAEHTPRAPRPPLSLDQVHPLRRLRTRLHVIRHRRQHPSYRADLPQGGPRGDVGTVRSRVAEWRGQGWRPGQEGNRRFPCRVRCSHSEFAKLRLTPLPTPTAPASSQDRLRRLRFTAQTARSARRVTMTMATMTTSKGDEFLLTTRYRRRACP